jgi:putative transposase
MYLVVIMDWHSRYVLAWRLSNTLDEQFCLEALAEALSKGRPQSFNTDQGAQFTSQAFTGLLEQHGVRVSMDGKGRYTDNLFIERLWRSLKYEEVYLKAYTDGKEARTGIGAYLDFYNQARPHQGLGYRTPEEVFLTSQETISSEILVESSESIIPTPAVVGAAGFALNRPLSCLTDWVHLTPLHPGDQLSLKARSSPC